MPTLASIVKRVFLHQTLLYWAKQASGTYGKPVYDKTNPLVLPCRWEDKQQEILDDHGRKVLSMGYVLTVDKLSVGGLVMLGSLSDFQSQPNYPEVPTNAQGGREVLLVKTTPDLKAVSSIYEVYL